MIRLAVSMGDPSGIGPEITARALARLSDAPVVPYAFGDAAALESAAAAVGLGLPMVNPGERLPSGGALIAVSRLPGRAARPGKPTAAGGRAQLAYLQAAFDCVRRGDADALCTAPVSKAQIQRSLPGFVGHTEWLEERCDAGPAVMMFASARLRVALVTTHLRLARVPRAVSAAGILETVEITHRALQRDFGVAAPRIAVCGMNPHAGEHGAFGDDEERLVSPAIARARRRRIAASGPYPADSVYFRAASGEFDAVVALYHDQGLIPVKLLDALMGNTAVNVTLGLPIIRTSPDHGVAYDIAGSGRANVAPMEAALRLAAQLAAGRHRSGS